MARVTVASNQTTAPRWAGDWFSDDCLMPGGAKVDPNAFYAEDAVLAVVGAAGAAANATTVPVDALSGPIPNGTVLDFGGKKFARLTVAAITGDTALTVSALATALVDRDTARYLGTLLVSVPSGTLLGRTYAERDAGTPFGPAADADDEFYLLAWDVTDLPMNNDAELYRHGKIVYENYLPVFSALSATLKGKIRALYECSVATN